MKTSPIYKALSIAGFDGSGGAGLQADLKTFCALGCYGTTVLTSLPVQNTMGVRSIHDITTLCIQEQMEAILDDMHINAVKIGMLHRPDIIQAVAKTLIHYKMNNIVLDPVMVAKSGDKLLLPEAIASIKQYLFPIATIITPNLPEAAELLGRKIHTKDHMEQAARELLSMGPQAVIVKGGHLDTNCDDCLCIKNEIYWLPSQKIPTKNTHGTGCTFSAAIASFIARGFPIVNAVRQAKQYITKSIEAGANLQIGRGNGPVHHFHHLWNQLPQEHSHEHL